MIGHGAGRFWLGVIRIILVEVHKFMLHSKYQRSWSCGFRKEYF